MWLYLPKPLIAVLFIFDHGSFNHTHTRIHARLYIGHFHGNYSSKTFFHDSVYFSAILPAVSASLVYIVDSQLLYWYISLLEINMRLGTRCHFSYTSLTLVFLAPGHFLLAWHLNDQSQLTLPCQLWEFIGHVVGLVSCGLAANVPKLTIGVVINHQFLAFHPYNTAVYYDLASPHIHIQNMIFDPGIVFPLDLFMRCSTCLKKGLFEESAKFNGDDAYVQAKSSSMLMISFTYQLRGFLLYGEYFAVSSIYLTISILVMHSLPSKLPWFCTIMMLDWCLYYLGAYKFWSCWSCCLFDDIIFFICTTGSFFALKVACTVLNLFFEHDQPIFSDIPPLELTSCRLWKYILLPPLASTLVKQSLAGEHQGLNHIFPRSNGQNTYCCIDLISHILWQFHYKGDFEVDCICSSYIGLHFCLIWHSQNNSLHYL